MNKFDKKLERRKSKKEEKLFSVTDDGTLNVIRNLRRAWDEVEIYKK